MNATVYKSKHRNIISALLATQGLTGCDCDTMAAYYGIGKAVALKVLRAGVHAQATQLIYVRVYLSGNISSILQCIILTEVCQKIQASQVARDVAGAPKPASLPPTNEVF